MISSLAGLLVRLGILLGESVSLADGGVQVDGQRIIARLTQSNCSTWPHRKLRSKVPSVDSALSLLLETGQSFDYAEVRDLAEPKPPEAPALVLSGTPDLKIYDGLLVGSLAGSGVCG